MSEHVVSVRTYITIFLALMVLTAVTVAVAFVDLGMMNNLVAMTIAVIKATLVILFFMHVRYSTPLTWVIIAAGFFWLAVLIGLTLSDYVSRGWMA